MNGWLAGLIFAMGVTVEPAIYHPVVKLCELLNLDARIVFSVILVESGFARQAKSPAGAIGLMQLMPANLTAMGVKGGSAIENLTAGTILLKRYLRMFSGNLIHALAAYNAGPTAVLRYHGLPPYSETRAYVRKVCLAVKNNRYRCGKRNGSEEKE